MRKQEQFLDVVDRDEAERRFREAIRLAPLGIETVALSEALGRVLARDVVSTVDVPSFDRSNYDGFAVQATDTYGAQEEQPCRLQLHRETIATAVVPRMEVVAGTATAVATGAIVPRGADAVVMVEHADVHGDQLLVHRPVTPGFGVAFAGTDIAAGEIVVRRSEPLTSRETGVLAAIGVQEVVVYRRPRVGILSTGDEIIPPGEPMQPGRVYDSNARILADATRELGAEPVVLGIVADDLDRLQQHFDNAMETCDVVVLSGGTSKGSGDLSYRVVRQLTDPGIVAHGVALKPGKPRPVGCQGQLGNRSHGVSAGGARPVRICFAIQRRQGVGRGKKPGCVSNGERVGIGHDLQSSGRLRDDRSAQGDSGCWLRGGCAVARSRFAGRRSGCDW
jgi:putative molybdopterin biosynthesis protein